MRAYYRPPLISPPAGLVVGVAASLVVALVAALVWHTNGPDAADAEMMRWQEVARVRADGIATVIAYAVGPLALLSVLASAASAGPARRWDAVVLALVTCPGALVIELLLKQVVHRQRPEGADLLYPSGHVAVATAAAVTAVLVLRATSASRGMSVCVAWLAGWFVVGVAAARLVQTVHYVTDVVGGAALGLAMTCWAALAISTGCRSGLLGVARSRPSGTRLPYRPSSLPHRPTTGS